MDGDERIKARIDARKEAEAILELIAETTLRWPDTSKDARRHFLETIDATVHGALFPFPAKPPEKPVPKPTPEERKERNVPPDAQEALESIDEMEELALEVPDAGQDFAADVLEKARSIGRTIARANSVTGPQFEALRNMRDGLARWIRD